MTPPEASSVEVAQRVVFGRAGGRDLHCDIYRPAELAEPAPAILMLHAGGWVKGDPSMMVGYGRAMARRGYVCVASEYRLADEHPWPAQLEDARTALRWLHAEHAALGIDPERIAIWGQSAGAHLGLLIAGPGADRVLDGAEDGAVPEVAAVVAFYPITTIGPEAGEVWDKYVSSIIPLDAPEEQRRPAGPLSHVDERFPPTLLLHGGQDTLVVPEQSIRFFDALRELGVPASLHLFAEQPHGFDLDRGLARQAAILIEGFLDYFVNGVRPEPMDISV